jgi:cytochrome c biogenesis protein CcmG/thiol:disulfide interchange protein DsbE
MAACLSVIAKKGLAVAIDSSFSISNVLSRRLLLALPAAAFAGLAGLFVWGLSRDPAKLPSTLIGREFPEFNLPPVQGRTLGLSSSDLKGQVSLVNFFASWCVPCRKEMPAFEAVSAGLKDRVAFVGVNHLDDRQGALRMVADTGVTYPTGYDPEGRVAATYGLFGMPTTLFVAPDGRLLETYTGELSRDQLEKSISRLFGV